MLPIGALARIMMAAIIAKRQRAVPHPSGANSADAVPRLTLPLVGRVASAAVAKRRQASGVGVAVVACGASASTNFDPHPDHLRIAWRCFGGRTSPQGGG